MRRTLGCVTLLVFSVGCASTVVKKNPGEHDRGIRFYRPKPYLLVQAGQDPLVITSADGQVKAVGAAGTDRYVTIELKYMPDFSEEYSIRAKTGIGTNKTKVTLADGWNLTEVDQELDSKVAENVEALSKLLDSAKGLGLGATNATPNAAGAATKFVVRASNVPIGFYEAVLSPGPDGRKQLYGWRYVGFAPYEPCPLTVCGGASGKCDTAAVYGLAFDNGVMTFKPLSEIQAGSSAVAPQRTGIDVATLADEAKKAIQSFNPTLSENATVFIEVGKDGAGANAVVVVRGTGIDQLATAGVREKAQEAVRQALLRYGHAPVTVDVVTKGK